MFVQTTRPFVEWWIVVIVCLVTVAVSQDVSFENSAEDPYEESRLVNGRDISIADANYMAQIRSFGGNAFQCGGAIVSPWHIVTAAHCFDNRSPSQFKVVVAEDEIVRDPTKPYSHVNPIRRSIARLHLPEGKYREGGLDWDVAVITMKRALKFNRRYDNNTHNVEFCEEHDLAEGDHVSVYGWGHTTHGSSSYSNQLQTITVPVLPMSECKQVHDITETMFCAGRGHSDACQGDSGGPVIVNSKLCGVVSWGIGCGDEKYPGVYTSIPAVRSFIDEAMRWNTEDPNSPLNNPQSKKDKSKRKRRKN